MITTDDARARAIELADMAIKTRHPDSVYIRDFLYENMLTIRAALQKDLVKPSNETQKEPHETHAARAMALKWFDCKVKLGKYDEADAINTIRAALQPQSEITCACGDTFTEDAKCINCQTADQVNLELRDKKVEVMAECYQLIGAIDDAYPGLIPDAAKWLDNLILERLEHKDLLPVKIERGDTVAVPRDLIARAVSTLEGYNLNGFHGPLIKALQPYVRGE